jgi:very-short-patch-repair endonuclease
MISKPEELLAYQIKLMNFPVPVREYKFVPGRKFRADFAWPDRMLLLEVEGGTWIKGRHTTGGGYESDCEKYSLAALLGYRVMRFTTSQIKKGMAVSFLERVFQ